MAIKTESLLAVGSLIYADNAELKAPFARVYNSEKKVYSSIVFKNTSYLGKVVSLDDLAKGFVKIEGIKDVATSYKNTDGKTIKSKTKSYYVKLTEVNTQKAVITAMKTKYCKGSSTGGTVNVRPDASITKAAIAVLVKGQPVSATGRTMAGFTEISVISTNGSALKGWVFSTLLSDTVPTAAVTTTASAKVKKRKATVPSKKPNVEPTEYDKLSEGDSVEIKDEDGKTGYGVVAKDTTSINYGGVALSLIIIGGLIWVGKKLLGKKQVVPQGLKAGK